MGQRVSALIRDLLKVRPRFFVARIVQSVCGMRQSRILFWPWHFRLRDVRGSFKSPQLPNSHVHVGDMFIQHRIDRTAIAVGLIHKDKQGMNLLWRHIEAHDN